MTVEVYNIDGQDPEPAFAILAPADAIALWPEIREHFEAALGFAHDRTTPEHVLARVLTGDLYLLVVSSADFLVASFTFERVQNRDGYTLHCMTLAGEDMESWVDQFLDIWKQLAAELGCSRISIKGRAGWQKFALKKGFKHQYTIMYQEVQQ